MKKLKRTLNGHIKALSGVSGKDLQAWKAAGEPKEWPQVQKDPFEGVELPDHNDMVKVLSTPNKSAQPMPPTPLKVQGDSSLYFKVYVEIGASLIVVRGKMDRVTKQCNIEDVSVPRNLLEPVLLAMYGKSLKNVVYESAL